MKNILFIILSILSLSVYSQSTEDNEEVRNWLDEMFKYLDKSKIPNGFLRDFAFELADLDAYNGKELNDSNYVNRTAYENIMRTIRSSAVGASPFNVDDILTMQYSMRQKNKAVMGVVLYQYSYIKADALTNQLIRYENEHVYDNTINGVWQNPYASAYTLGFSAQDTVFYGNNIVFTFPANLWKSNVTISKAEFDADDGRGYVSISKGGQYIPNYSSDGIKHLKLKIVLNNGNILYSHSLAKIYLLNSATTRGVWDNAIFPDKNEDIIAETAYNGVKPKGRISYLYSRNNPNKVTKPLIIVEGFDPIEFLTDTTRFYKKDVLYGNTHLGSFLNDLQNANYSVYDKLKNEYDIIYIDLFNSMEYIQANANLLETALKKINEYKRENGSEEKNIILGQSMGGLIARYALKKMETKEIPHQTSLLICQDTPHLGANIPLGLLYSIHGLKDFFHKKHILSKIVGMGGTLSKVLPIAYSHAAAQMLTNYVDYNGNIDNSQHIEWQRELSQIGYPQGDKDYKIRIVGISNGSGTITNAYSPYVYIDGKGSLSILSNIVVSLWGPYSGLGLGILTENWGTFILGMMPGSNSGQLHVDINPGTSGSSKLCEMSLRYVKKFLWLIKIKSTIFSYEKYMPPLAIRHDIMPGSYYNFRSILTSHNEESDKKWDFLYKYNVTYRSSEKFLFISTASALDVGGGKTTLSESDYLKKYSMEFPPQAPKDIPFEAYYITERSEPHISFENKMLNWMLDQMATKVDGPEIAVTGSKYEIRNNLKDYTVTWRTSDESIATIDNSGVVTMKKHGYVTIIADCTSGTVKARFYKDIMAGLPLFVLDWDINGKYIIKAKCLDGDIDNYSKYISYEWAVKPETGGTLNWEQSFDPNYSINNNLGIVNVYMRAALSNGIKGNPVYIKIDTNSPYVFSSASVIISNQGKVFTPLNITIKQNPNYKSDINTEDKFNIYSLSILVNYEGNRIKTYNFGHPLKTCSFTLNQLIPDIMQEFIEKNKFKMGVANFVMIVKCLGDKGQQINSGAIRVVYRR